MELDTCLSMALSPNNEDVLYFINKRNQLMKVNIALDGTDTEKTKFEYVHCEFHDKPVTGLDTCLRK